MKNISIKKLALISGLFLGAFILLMFFLLFDNAFKHHLTSVLLCIAFIVIAHYILFVLLTERYINQSIKKIYRKIRNTKQVVYTPENTTIETAESHVDEWVAENAIELERLKVRESYRREFIGNVSHELKTPIFNIQGYVLTLLDGAIDDPEINVRYLQRTVKSVERMIHIVEDLEQITNLEAGVLQTEMESHDIRKIAADAIEILEYKSYEKNVKIKFKSHYPERCFVICDKGRIQQVLINLLVNAIKYGNENQEILINIEEKDNKGILIEVIDQGNGIAPEHLPRLFERFFRIDKARTSTTGGSGLGLAIVKHILEAHQSEIQVQSELGVGTTFYFYLQKA
ncbi:MAG: sensor histidine kinase [Flavobacteriales bacterium]